jgi:hypothetical protein
MGLSFFMKLAELLFTQDGQTVTYIFSFIAIAMAIKAHFDRKKQKPIETKTSRPTPDYEELHRAELRKIYSKIESLKPLPPLTPQQLEDRANMVETVQMQPSRHYSFYETASTVIRR